MIPLLALLAHGSNVDEIALIVAPLAVVGGALYFANRWAKKHQESENR